MGAGVFAAALFFLLYLEENAQPPMAEHLDYAAFRSLSQEEQIKTLESIIKAQGIESAWSFLQAAYPIVTDNPHHLTHFLGDRAYELLGIDGIALCAKTSHETFGGYGCYHALTARALAERGPSVIQEVRDRCANFRGASYPALGACLHGMGHGLITFKQFDLQRALPDCDVLRDDEEHHCWDGIFMEYTFSLPREAYKKERPWFLCSSIPEKYKLRCAFYLSQMLLTKLDFDVRRSAEVCVNSGDDALVEPCLTGIGFYVSRRSMDDIEMIRKECFQIQDSGYRSSCIIAALKGAVYLGFLDWRKSALPVCRELEEAFRAKCETTLQTFSKTYQRD